jgi:trimeric autotransporter adhesin
MLSLMLLFVIVAGGTVACAGNAPTVTCPNVTNPGTTTGTYVITVTGTAGAITQTEKVTVTVQ